MIHFIEELRQIDIHHPSLPREPIAMDTLAVRLLVPLTGPRRDFHPQVSAPLPGAHKKEAAPTAPPLLLFT